MERDNFTCCSCGDPSSTLNVHHKSYTFGNNVWEYEDDNLITLCDECHSAISDSKKIIKSIIDTQLLDAKKIDKIEDIIVILYRLELSDIIQIRKIIYHFIEQNKL